MMTESYRGYLGTFRIDVEAGVIRGKVVNTRDTITFQGKTVPEAVAAFRDSVDDYLEFCAAHGEEPEKPYSGKLVLRLDPETHREVALMAEEQDMSINTLILTALKKAMRPRAKPRALAGAAKPSGPAPKGRPGT
jgi:predicted HicB family RNase H-like nuclease